MLIFYYLGQKIMKKEKSKSTRLLYLIAISCLLIFAILVASAIIDIGNKLRNINDTFGKYIEIGFYALMALIIIFGIIRPIYIIFRSPDLSIITVENQNSKMAVRTYKKVAKIIVKNNDLKEDELLMLTKYHDESELLFSISYVFKNNIKKQLNGIIIRNAKIVMISTAICQNGKFDMMTVFAINVKMIKELVLKCGFRPSTRNLSKLTINVFSTALIADGIQNLTLEDVMPNSLLNTISDVPFLGKIVESVLDGAANALMTLRIGCVTRRYLYSDGEVVTKSDIRAGAFKESMALIPEVALATAGFFPKKIIRFFTKNKKGEEENGEQ